MNLEEAKSIIAAYEGGAHVLIVERGRELAFEFRIGHTEAAHTRDSDIESWVAAILRKSAQRVRAFAKGKGDVVTNLDRQIWFTLSNSELKRMSIHELRGWVSHQFVRVSKSLEKAWNEQHSKNTDSPAEKASENV